MRWSLIAITLSVFLMSHSALGAVYVSGSVNQSTSNLGFQKQETRGGSLSIDLGLGQYIRIGITHQQNFKESLGWEENEDLPETDPARYEPFSSKEYISANSLDFTFILYEGTVIVPYLKIGGIWKSYTIERVTATEIERTEQKASSIPEPNLGVGAGIKLNQQFTIKLFHRASPSAIYDEKLNKAVPAWDRDTTVGISYKL